MNLHHFVLFVFQFDCCFFLLPFLLNWSQGLVIKRKSFIFMYHNYQIHASYAELEFLYT